MTYMESYYCTHGGKSVPLSEIEHCPNPNAPNGGCECCPQRVLRGEVTLSDILKRHGLSMAKLSKRFNIPYRTVQDWNAGRRKCPDYVFGMIDELLSIEEKK